MRRPGCLQYLQPQIEDFGSPSILQSTSPSLAEQSGVCGVHNFLYGIVYSCHSVYIQLLDFVFGVTLLTLNISLVSRLHLPS